MKIFLLQISALAITCPVFAQFTTSGNITSTNNVVGIGTANPTSTLSVNGSFDVSNSGNLFFYNGAADINFRYAGRGSGGRALVHEAGNMLVLNYGGDFTGGTMLGTNAYFTQSNSGSSYIQFGNVGIGNNTPAYKLDVTGSARFTSGVYVPDGTPFGVVSTIGISWANTTLIYKGYSNNIGDYAEILVPGSTSNSANIRLIQNGNVGIGTITPDAKLSVNGTIHTKEVKVDMNGWSDYVFKPSYNLTSLKEVKTYIDKNHHLPEMPSEQQIIKDGVNLGEMVKLQTKKIEELTLYLIEKDKQVSNEKHRIDKQEQQLKELRQQIKALSLKNPKKSR